MKRERGGFWRSMVPTRIRSLLIINVVLAVGFTVAHALVNDVHLRELSVLLIAVLVGITIPFGLVENYLYKKRRGWWYQLGQAPDARRQALRDDKPPYKRTRPSDGERSGDASGTRTRLFDALPAGDLVSRASIMKTVAERLQAEGKSEAAKRCQELIDERYGEQPSG